MLKKVEDGKFRFGSKVVELYSDKDRLMARFCDDSSTFWTIEKFIQLFMAEEIDNIEMGNIPANKHKISKSMYINIPKTIETDGNNDLITVSRKTMNNSILSTENDVKKYKDPEFLNPRFF